MIERVEKEQKIMFDPWRGFTEKKLPGNWYKKFTGMAKTARANILKMTTLAESGHPGGSMSGIDIYLMLYNMANVDAHNPYRDDRDRIIISDGHTSPGVYSALGAAGFFDVDDAITFFRKAGSSFEGHVERSVPGVEWGTGNLGQGLAAGIGKAIYARLSKQDFHTYVVMGDGEQQKGQISESRRIAMKYNLNRLTAIIDYNQLQISGRIKKVMPQHIVEEWQADGWRVIEIDGHNFNQIYDALYTVNHNDGNPVLILAHTVMGKGVSFMENDEKYHGSVLKPEQLDDALRQLGGFENDLEKYRTKRLQKAPFVFDKRALTFPMVKTGEPITYGVEVKMDNRSAFGKALVSVAEANFSNKEFPMAVFDCDLAKSVKTNEFAQKYPDNFFQFGISEHSTATASGSLSVEKALSVWADFGVFGIGETYNQARLNDINRTNLKLFCTHCGVNVGEDGVTHQCIDYFALLNAAYGWKVITPADPNQTDRVVRYVLSQPGNFAVIMGRAKNSIITNLSGEPYFGGSYEYRYGRMEWIRQGEKIALVAAGHILWVAMESWKELHNKDVDVSLVSVSDWSDINGEDLKMLSDYENVVVLEDHNVKNGLGTTISEKMFHAGFSTKITKIGVEHYGSSGKTQELYRLLGMDSKTVVKKIINLLMIKE